MAVASTASALVCKWNLDAQRHDWDESFFEAAGLSDLPLTKIGTRNDVKGVGNVVARLGTKAAEDLGLQDKVPLELPWIL